MLPLFRSSLMGFNKEDVTNFLIKINRKNEDERAAFEKSLKEQTARKEEEIAKREEVCAEILKRNDENLALLAQLPDLRDRFRELGESFRSASREASEREKELRRDLEILKGENDALQVYRAKAERFDQLAGALSAVVGTAPLEIPKKEEPENEPAEEAGGDPARLADSTLAETLETFEEILSVLEKPEF